jgi:anti-anti-sigma regulatory factor
MNEEDEEEKMATEKSNAMATAMAARPTPITILWKSVLMLPIVGVVDTKRAQDIMERALIRIQEYEAKIVILDILGVPIVDSAVANHLIKISGAAKIMGCNCIITGISPSIAQALVHLGIDLKDGVELAFGMLGLEVREKKEAVKKTA